MESGIELIASERQRQIDTEGWTIEHDNTHTKGELAQAAMVYAMPFKLRPFLQPTKLWPWNLKWWKPGERINELTKAGALIAAEIDRLQLIKEE